MNIKKILTGLGFFLFIPAAIAQVSTEAEPGMVADSLFAAMKEKNAGKIRGVFTSDGQLVAIDKPKSGDGISTTRVFTAESFAKSISESKAGEFIERMPVKDVHITGDLAIVTGRYTFHVGDKFSHCGTNTFNMVRTADGWKIANAASTLEFKCDADIKTVTIPVIEASPADVSSIDGIIKAFYETISGPVGQPRQWGRDRTLYKEGIIFYAVERQGEKTAVRRMPYNEYVNASDESLVKGGFSEREISRTMDRYGNIAQVFSTYEWQTADKKFSGRGINSILLLFDGKRWWITAASWEGETPENKIPAEYLRASEK